MLEMTKWWPAHWGDLHRPEGAEREHSSRQRRRSFERHVYHPSDLFKWLQRR